MDLSGLIFVALAVAWAAYLIPKALRHHDDVVRGRSVDGFSQSLRVLARREPVSARRARLVVEPTRATAGATSTADEIVARRLATSHATKRRRRVLTLLVLALAAVVAGGASGRLSWTYVAIPVALLLAWLVACRLMVRRESAWLPATEIEPEVLDDASAETGTVPAVMPETPPRDPALWDPVPVTLPTYVSKPAARRRVRTIDLDSTGVWTSGRSEADSALAREAEAAERVARRDDRQGDTGERAAGS